MDPTSNKAPFKEQRAKPRIKCNYPAIVMGHDAQGKKYQVDARVINLGRGGAYAILKQPIQNGEVVSVSIAFPTGALQWGTPRLATSSVVVRSEQSTDEVFGIAVQFVRFKFW